jgi:type II secretory pathway pseudopilin PulG
MQRLHKKYFTLIELMFVIAILVILIGISWVAGTKVLRKQTQQKTKAEITLLVSAVKQYKERWGSYPGTSTASALDFADYLSKVSPSAGWVGERPMFIDFKKSDMIEDGGTVSDPYENEYMFQLSTDENSFIIYSKGLDAVHEKSTTGAEDYDETKDNNLDNVTSNDL